MKMALLVIDMQKGFLEDKQVHKDAMLACEYINEVAGYLRENGHYVVIVQDIEVEGGVESSAYEVIPEITLDVADILISKKWSNSFWETELEQQLRDREVDFIIVAGFAAQHCVLFTYNGALERGFKTVILQHGVLSHYADAVTALYRDRHIISYPVIEVMSKY